MSIRIQSQTALKPIGPRLPYLVSAGAIALALAACGPDTELTADAPAYEAPAEAEMATSMAAAEHEARVAAAQAFINGAGQTSLMQISAGQLALQHATNPEVKSFAQLMVDQHGASLEALSAAAAAAALAPPVTALAEPQMRRVNELVPIDGDADAEDSAGMSKNFDASYMAFQVESHDAAVRAYDSYAAGGEIDPLRIFAGQTLPALREHQARAAEIRVKLGESALQPS